MAETGLLLATVLAVHILLFKRVRITYS